MIKNIITYFIDRPLIGHFIYIIVFGVFLMILPQMYREMYPYTDSPYISIKTYYPGASAQEIELKITNRIEKKLNVIPDIESSISYSQQHVSIIILKINSRVKIKDIDKSLKKIQNELLNIYDMPFGSLPSVVESISTDTPVARLALVQNENNAMDLNNTFRDFENELKKLKNIGKINKFGIPQKQALIELDPYKLKQYGFSAYDVIESLSINLQNFPAGSYYQNLTNYNVLGFGEIADLKDLKNHALVVNDNGGKTTLGQLGDIRLHLQPEDHFFKLNGRPALIFEINRTPQTDYITLAKDLIALSKKYNKNNCEVVIFENNARYLEKRIEALNSNLLTGFLLVFLILYLFLGRKVSFFVSMGIPFSFAGTFICMHLFGISINAISLAGLIIILGMIVDDTVTIADNVYRYQENGKSLREACIEGTREMIGGVFMSYLTTMVSFLPLAFLPGIMGTLLKDLPYVVMICMTISIVEGICIFPGHLLKFRESKSQFVDKTNKINNRLNQILQKAIDRALDKKNIFLLSVLGLTIISIFYVSNLTYVYFPEENVETFYILTESKADVTLDQNVNQVKQVEKVLQQLPSGTIKNYVTSHGVNGLFNKHFRNTKIGKKYSQISVYLVPKEQRKIRISEVIQEIEKKIKQTQLFSDIQIVKENLGPATDKTILIDLMSDDLALANTWSKKIYTDLQKEKGVIDLTYNANQFDPETKLQLNQNKISQYQLSGAQVLAELRSGLDGFPINSVSMLVDGEPVPVVVKTKKIEGNLKQYLNILSVNNRKGGMIPLSSVTKMNVSHSPSVIFHRNNKRAVRIEANTNPKMISGLKVRNNYIEKYDKVLPAGVNINKSRIILDEEENIKAMSNALLISFLLNFFCMLVYYHSISKPILILASVPAALIGVAFALFTHNIPFSTAIHMALVGLIGGVVNNAIILVDHIELLLSQGLNVRDAVKRGVEEKFRAIVLTAGATVLGLITTAYGFGGYEPFVAPLMLAYNWGLISSTIIILFLIPCFYILKEKELYKK